MKKIIGLLVVVAVALVCIPVVSMAGEVTVDKALYGSNCAAPNAVCVDVKSALQAICDAQNKGCKTKKIGTEELLGQAAGNGLHAELTCVAKGGIKETYDNAADTCMIACGATGGCLR